eukprot:TRINITY_DN7552_c0_g1_i1.p1 TRINITY_DN7552_c0_g1~~TRINITY_DN7552_c0_g1_i1.p1  ORF type:complete len:272 (-),score=48.43 TRINITY_DN7552_c0_g1_i1:99-914(-)
MCDAIQQRVFSANEKSFHEDCFVCTVDGVPIGEEKPFHVRGDDIYCVLHYREKFIHTCKTCTKDIEGKYINVLDFFYHEECFVCEGCNTSLLDGDFQMAGEGFKCPACAPEGPAPQSRIVDEQQEYKTAPAPGSPPPEPQDASEPQYASEPQHASEPPPGATVASPVDIGSPSPPVEEEPPSQYSVGEDTSRIESQREQEEVGTSYSLAQLQDKDSLPDDLDKGNREKYLSDRDFKEIFKMDKHDFGSLAVWKKKQLQTQKRDCLKYLCQM